MDENCKRQKEVERTYGGLLPAVEGHSLGTRYKHTELFYTKVITAQIVYILHIKPKIEGKRPHLLSRKGSNCYIHIIMSDAT